MVNRIDVRMAELFKDAVRHNAPSILLSHAHPSGIPDASREDIRLTEHAVEAARLLDIWLLDHLVVGDGVWVSLKELDVIDW
jgi:DNA repair protein RadC